MSTLEVAEFNKICRLCLNKDDSLINIFFSEAAAVISEITSIVLKEGDFLPENICIGCMDKATEFYHFRQRTEANNLTLRAVLGLTERTDFIQLDKSTVKPFASTEHSNELSTCHNEKIFDNKIQLESTVAKPPDKAKLEIKRSYKDLIPLESYNRTVNSKEDSQNQEIHDETDNIADAVHEKISEIGAYEELPFEAKIDQERNDNTEEAGLGDSQSTTSEEKPSKSWCEHCHCSVDTESIEDHLKDYHPENGSHYCYLCTKGSSSVYTTVKQLKAHLKYHTQIPKLQCEECGKWFKYPHQKLVHMRTHTGERPVICDVCSKSFRDPRYLTIHLKSHTGERPYKCTICQKGFGHKFILKLHLKTHTLERDLMCSMCGKTFIYSHNLKIHMRRHTGEKPYTCRLCFTSFTSSSVLHIHMLTHSDQKRFECTVCGKKFKRTSYLTIHMRSHTGEKPYACTLCNNKYKMSSHLSEHMKTHTGEKNYICEICPKSFYNNKALQVHKETHAGNKTYGCTDCDKRFVHHTSLYAHRRKQHKESKQ